MKKKEEANELRHELKRLNKLKRIVQQRYEEKSDKKIYTRQIMKLLDKHVIAGNITKTNIVSIFDNKIFEQFIARTDITDGDKAHQINAQIQDTIKDYVNIDHAFYQKFSTLNK